MGMGTGGPLYFAPGLPLIAEFFMALTLRSVTMGEQVAGRDPVAGTVYMVMLATFALMPAAAGRMQ